ncbi:Hexapeptide repeat of succinyl-transferase [Vibrio sp. B1ASS3]|uniref:acyltransferase n=1 Tax=Vibrio sp. B1ASS3 TaxID=2751176 RepID=UPI001ABAAF88|nr:acyltransferase [Vibrio sp. B1ASS3]CAD7817386.1 Hexapeptide repeat of succinyl-transferase [Vibrio sp. B1ASS3]CAE6931181.1 Hexapeptide repeat of succinyl-transferase [Vibrio sp. B1ASS3]
MNISKIRTILRELVIRANLYLLCSVYKMNIDKTAKVSLRAKIDKTYPEGINIGSYSYISNGAMILTHDFINKRKLNTSIGSRCFVGANTIIMPGIAIGDDVIIGAGSVVTKDVDDKSIVVGNPAKIIKKNNGLDLYGKYKK